ncbi:Gfo/Idh/MocA family protein [Sulfodiicoccus acidiphilus]|uniref:Gfo/Idh/MocA family protein n=1 Tax=Sulfodiicoccus acidiphilus TaxID=1670455 RepID=UPI000F82A3EF|nr:Gfo/Idh/MocA family oxidoreductase [Sulfodiicoccus acidiphilus]
MGLGVGVIGYGFMGRAHSLGWRNVAELTDSPLTPSLVAMSGRNVEALRAVASRFGYRRTYTDFRELVRDPEVQVVDNTAPNYLHREPIVEAIEAGKHVVCEKPLANTVEDAYEMYKAAKRAGTIHMLAHNYRFVPAIVLAKQILSKGSLGKIYHFRGLYLQQWLSDPKAPISWRLKRELAGYGALGDLGSHVIDLARYLIGEMSEVKGHLETFVRRRPSPQGLNEEEVTVDDSFQALVKFENGASGVIEASRMATGHDNFLSLEVNGSEGALRFNLERLNELEVYYTSDGETRGFRTVLATQSTHPYMRFWWPPGHVLGWEHTFTHELYHFTLRVSEDRSVGPEAATFEDGWRTAVVMDKIAKSSETGKWESVTT